MRTQVRSLASLGGLRIRRHCELWCRWQARLRCHIAVAVVWISSFSSDSTPSLGASMCCGCGIKKTKNKNKLLMQLRRKKQIAGWGNMGCISFISLFSVHPEHSGLYCHTSLPVSISCPVIWGSEIIWSLASSVKSGGPGRGKKEDDCLIRTRGSVVKSLAESFHLASKSNLELNLWGGWGCFVSWKTNSFCSRMKRN